MGQLFAERELDEELILSVKCTGTLTVGLAACDEECDAWLCTV